jgi:hypothetical protein
MEILKHILANVFYNEKIKTLIKEEKRKDFCLYFTQNIAHGLAGFS